MSIRITESGLMKHLMDNIRDNIYFMDRDGRIILINKEGAKWLGFNSPEEAVGKTDLDIFTNEHGREAFEDEQRIMETGIPLLGKEEKETWADGSETWVTTSKMPLRDDDGSIVGTFGISRDITEHKNAEIRAEELAGENRRFREEMENELQMASELQKTFFPTSYPVFPQDAAQSDSVVQFSHMHSAGRLVGGDFCSVRKLSETDAGIFLCDFMGHGVQAALGTAIVRAMVEEISHRHRDPGGFLTHMNRALTPILRQGGQFMFASACYMVLDVSNGALRYANAGHPAPILYTRESARILASADAVPGAALAIDVKMEYETVEVTIAPGDSVFMFTDGLFEVENAAREEYGIERLLAAVEKYRIQAPGKLFPSLLEEVHRFADGDRMEDDVCLVGFSFCERLVR